MATSDRDPLKEGDESGAIRDLIGKAAGKTGKPSSDRATPLYPSEIRRRGNKATYDVGAEVIEAVKEIAIKERVAGQQSRVARALLRYAIGAYEAGEITLEVEHEGSDWWLEAVEK